VTVQRKGDRSEKATVEELIRCVSQRAIMLLCPVRSAA
jgi:hypothetical protein